MAVPIRRDPPTRHSSFSNISAHRRPSQIDGVRCRRGMISESLRRPRPRPKLEHGPVTDAREGATAAREPQRSPSAAGRVAGPPGPGVPNRPSNCPTVWVLSNPSGSERRRRRSLVSSKRQTVQLQRTDRPRQALQPSKLRSFPENPRPHVLPSCPEVQSSIAWARRPTRGCSCAAGDVLEHPPRIPGAASRARRWLDVPVHWGGPRHGAGRRKVGGVAPVRRYSRSMQPQPAAPDLHMVDLRSVRPPAAPGAG